LWIPPRILKKKTKTRREGGAVVCADSNKSDEVVSNRSEGESIKIPRQGTARKP